MRKTEDSEKKTGNNDKSSALIVKVPLNAGALSKKNGIEKSADAVLGELKEIFYIKSEMFEVREIVIDNFNIDSAHKEIADKSFGIFKSNKGRKIIFIGADHSLTYSTFSSFSKAEKGRAALVVLDAHADAEDSRLTHEDYLRNIIEDGFAEANDVFIVGLRNYTETEQEYIRQKRINIYSAGRVAENSIGAVADEIIAKTRGKKLYVSIDIDVLEPCFAPGTGYIEPGGLFLRELLELLRRFGEFASVFDIVEVNPDKDINNITSKTAAVIIAGILKP